MFFRFDRSGMTSLNYHTMSVITNSGPVSIAASETQSVKSLRLPATFTIYYALHRCSR